MRKVLKYATFGLIILCEMWLMNYFADLLDIPEEIRWRVQSGEENHWAVLVGLDIIFLTIAVLLLINAKSTEKDYRSECWLVNNFPVIGWGLKKNLYFAAFLLIGLIVVISAFFLIEEIRGVPRLWGVLSSLYITR